MCRFQQFVNAHPHVVLPVVVPTAAAIAYCNRAAFTHLEVAADASDFSGTQTRLHFKSALRRDVYHPRFGDNDCSGGGGCALAVCVYMA